MSQLRHRLPRAVLAACCALVLLAGSGVAGAASPEWNIERIGAPRSAAGVVIAVVDTGVDAAHPVFGDRVLPQIDLVDDGLDGDPQGHGTHVAGTAAGADNGCGSIGVAPDAQILPVRVLNAEGEGSSSDVAEGIRQAADAGAHVINLSIGEDVVLRQLSGSGLGEAIEYAWSKGSIPVMAAGNQAFLNTLFGTGYENLPVVIVTATDNQDRRASYAPSVGSARWGIAAPGGDTSGEPGRAILSSYPDDQCALLAGTSMAAPHVSGALAVLRRMGLSPQDAVERLLATARSLGSDRSFGAGLVDLEAAVGASQPSPTTAPAPSTTAPPPAPPTTAAAAGTDSPPAPTSTVPRSTTSSAPPATAAPATSSTETTPTTEQAASSSTTSSTTTPEDDLGAPVVVADEDEGRPGALLVAAAAGAIAVSAGAGAALLRARRLQP